MLNINHVLLPMNTSDASAAALPLATAVARMHGARLEVFHVPDARRDVDGEGGRFVLRVADAAFQGVDVVRVE